jgi:uncharacterized membrane protein
MKLALVVSFLAALFVLALPARAVESLYEVSGVSAGDVLNIRSRPSASAPKVGSYGPRESGIRIYRRQGTWALVGRADPDRPDGWVNANYLKLTVAARRVPLPLKCIGTEPFWSFTINSKSRATYSDPSVKKRRYGVLTFVRLGPDARFLVTGSGGLSRVKASQCSDGMSDNIFPYSARIKLPNGRTLDGCCRVQ